MKRNTRRRSVLGLGGAVLLPTLPGCASPGAAPPQPLRGLDPRTGGRIETVESWPSRHAAARKVVVWLPPGYDASGERHAVLYMHDGQNLFDPASAYGGQVWAVDRRVSALMLERAVRPTIVVAIWNTPLRWREYVPAPAVQGLPPELAGLLTPAGSAASREPLSDGYLRFIVDELKPWVDARWRTRPGREDTVIMGSSMGGLVSLYGLITQPQVFGAAGCVSTHWPVSTNYPLEEKLGARRVAAIANAHLDFVTRSLPPAGVHRLYFDHGSAGLDAWYAPFQARMDRILAARGYRQGVDCRSQVFPGANHDERSWRERLDVPLRFLLGRARAT